MRNSIRIVLALCVLAGVAAAAPGDPYAPEANDESAAQTVKAAAPEAKPAETVAPKAAVAPKPVEVAAPKAAAAPKPVEAAAPKAVTAPKAEAVPAKSEEATTPQAAAAAPAPAPEPAAVEAPAQPAPAAAAPQPAATPDSGKTPDWWGPIRDATNAEIDKSAAANSGTIGPATSTAASPASASTGGSLWRGLSALLIVLALIVASYALLIRIRRHAPMLAGGDFATVVGRLPLDPRFALHFVRVGEKVLLLGVTAQSINVLEVFDAASFQQGGGEAVPEAENHQDFLAHLRASGAALNPMTPGAADDEDIVSLRGDIERLKRYLQETPNVDPER